MSSLIAVQIPKSLYQNYLRNSSIIFITIPMSIFLNFLQDFLLKQVTIILQIINIWAILVESLITQLHFFLNLFQHKRW
jgi:hypothetical protein